jgi:hypothetical protein
MKISCLIVLLCLCTTLLFAQGEKKESYKSFIYTDENLDQLIEQSKEANRGDRSLLFDATTTAVKGIGMGYFTSVVDLGVNAVGALIIQNSENHKKWKEVVAAENKSSISIGTISGLKDFYSANSFDGVLDPKGMTFNGIGCLRTEGSDTVFYVSCHINKEKINSIVSHSKFELVLDNLIIDPRHSDVPNNSIYNIPFSFKERSYLEVGLDIKIISSWMTQVATLQNDQQLGEFKINLRITEKDLNSKGVLSYVRKENEPAKYSISGESFIIPRSYSGYRDENGRYKDCWGTGEYKVDITLSETCGVSSEYDKAWKPDWKKRKAIEAENKKNGTLLEQACQFTRNQEWDALAKQWVITTLKAPVGVITKDINKKLGLPVTTTGTTSKPTSAASTGNKSSTTPDKK